MAAESDAPDEQDQSEVYDEDNNELESQRYGGRDNEQTFEDLPDVLDVTQAVGDDDDDDDEAAIGDDMDDAEIVARARDDVDDDDNIEDDDLLRSEEIALDPEEDLTDFADGEDPGSRDGLDRTDPDEVELQYVGDLNDVAAAASAAQALESDSLSDADLRELDYKDEFTRDEDEAAASSQ
ncbi:MAG: hypothetical protein B7Y99_05690 [Caulobacterales bacterium 32-69-10]|nr:MAG: hypothetical protein B7Y99_05690 [Caulobacterales bacterium 32-69-10]